MATRRHHAKSPTWINEGPEPIVSRPEPEDLPNDFIESRKERATCSGFLEKLASSKWVPRWQLRYFELYGNYLIYNNSPIDEGTEGSLTAPLCYIDLRHVMIEFSSGEINLSSTDRSMKLRQCSYQPSVKHNNTTLSDWITKIRAAQYSNNPLLENFNNIYCVDGSSSHSLSISEPMPLANSTEQHRTSCRHSQVVSQNDVPFQFRRIMVCIGLIPSSTHSGSDQTPSMFERRMMWFKRILMILLFTCSFALTFSVGNTPKCADSIHFKDGKMPCILFFALYVTSSIYYACAGITYFWLVNYGNNLNEMMKTHRLRMVHNINRFTRYFLYFQLFMTPVWAINFLLYGYYPNEYQIETDNQSLTEITVSWMVFIVVCMILTIIVTWTLLPFLVFTVMYYSESRRLRCLLKDFNQLLNRRPLHMDSVSMAYMEMHDEWEQSQSRLSTVLSITSIGLFFELFGCMIGSLYTFESSKTRSNISTTMFWWTPLVGGIQFLPMILVLLLTTTGANKRAVKLKDCITRLIASTLVHTPIHFSGHMDNEESIVPLLSIEEGDVKLEEHQLKHIKYGQEVMKLCTLIDRLPCELKLFGRALSETDIAYLCGFLAFVQFVNLFGISWAVPL